MEVAARPRCPWCGAWDGVEWAAWRWYCGPCNLMFAGGRAEWDSPGNAEIRRGRRKVGASG